MAFSTSSFLTSEPDAANTFIESPKVFIPFEKSTMLIPAGTVDIISAILFPASAAAVIAAVSSPEEMDFENPTMPLPKVVKPSVKLAKSI